MIDDNETIGFKDILCFRCKCFNPVVDSCYDIGEHVSDEWLREPCDNSYYLCLKCRNFEEIEE